MYKPDDFKSLRHSPFKVPEGKMMTDAYGMLARVNAFTKVPDFDPEGRGMVSWNPIPKDIDIALRFIVLMYEPSGNPLIKEKDPSIRADYAWGLLGVKKSHVVRKAQQNWHPFIRHLMVHYLRLIHTHDYVVWVTMVNQLYQTIDMLQQPVSMEDIGEKDLAARLKMSELIESLSKKIAELERKIFPDEVAIKAAVVEETGGVYWAEIFALDYQNLT